MRVRLTVTLLLAATVGCTPADRSVTSADGRFTLQLRAPRIRPQTYQPPGWAELYGPFGLSCGTADFFGDALSTPVRWEANSVTVDGVKGSWSLAPCGFLAPPAPTKLPY